MMKKKIISIFAILIIFCTTNYTVFAITSADYKQKANETQIQADNAQQQLEQVEGQINSALQEIEDLNNSIDDIEEDVSSLSKELNSLNASIEEKEKDLEEKQKLLDERLSAAYMNSNNTYLEALFLGGILNFISNYDMIKQIAEYDTNLMNEVKNTKQELENERTKTENIKVQKEAKSAELKKLKSNKETKVSTLTDEQKQIQSQIEEYDNQMKILARKEKELVAKEAKEAEEAKRKNNSSNSNAGNSSNNGSTSNGGSNSNEGSSSTGRFQWPVPSSHNITSKYGYRIHPISGTKKFHAGIDIGAAGGANIVAGDSGTVMLASSGYNGGYGNYVIINHGNGVTTRYAHCSNLYVSTGETVTKGQVIAAVGSTGASTGNHCHFEVRINGESKNPMDYL